MCVAVCEGWCAGVLVCPLVGWWVGGLVGWWLIVVFGLQLPRVSALVW